MNATQGIYQDILVYIARYKQERGGESPTYREIGDEIGHGSTTVLWHLRKMNGLGMIILPDKHCHGIALPGEQYLPPPELDEKVE